MLEAVDRDHNARAPANRSGRGAISPFRSRARPFSPVRARETATENAASRVTWMNVFPLLHHRSVAVKIDASLCGAKEPGPLCPDFKASLSSQGGSVARVVSLGRLSNGRSIVLPIRMTRRSHRRRPISSCRRGAVRAARHMSLRLTRGPARTDGALVNARGEADDRVGQGDDDRARKRRAPRLERRSQPPGRASRRGR